MSRQGRKRAGKLAWPLAVLSAAGVAGTALMVPQMTKSKSNVAATTSVQTDQHEYEIGSPSGSVSSGSSSSITLPRKKTNSGGSGVLDSFPNRLQPTPPPPPLSPATGADIAAEETSEKRSIHDHSLGLLDEQPSSERDEPKGGSGGPPSSQSNSPFNTVEVYFATDRELIDTSSILHWTRILLPAVLGFAVCLIMIVALVRSMEKWLWGLGLSLSCILTILFVHHAWVYGEQTYRLMNKGSLTFGSRRYEVENEYPLHLGKSEITIPKNHTKGSIERPNIFLGEVFEDPNKHVMLQKISKQDEETYFQDLKKKIESKGESSAFVFIHGYNVEFADALLRTAQIAKDLEFQGAPILYSWPSHGSLLGYAQDEANVSWSVVHLEQFLRDVKARTGVKNLHIIAHSMGNRAMLGAIERISLSRPEGEAEFGQVVMAAPDVDVDEFESRYAEAVAKCSRQATLYTSGTDRALLASMKVHGYPRLGLSSGILPSYSEIDTIEVSPIDPSLLGHSYYGSHPLLIQDMSAIVELGEPPGKRAWLKKVESQVAGASTWRFEPRLANKLEPSVAR